MAETAVEQTDDELGIGEDVEAPAIDFAALLADPRMAALLDAAVAQRLAQMGAPAQPNTQSETLVAFTETIRHLIDTQAEQRPGYVKPLPAEEVDRRLAGKVELESLLARYKELGLAPLWTVGPGGWFECANAIEYLPGTMIRTYMHPAEDFVPENEPAAAVHNAMMQWLGGPTPGIGEQVEAAERDRNLPPIITGALQPDRRPGLAEVVKPPEDKQPPRARRTMGTIAPERHDISLADRASGAQGPVFAEA